MAEVGHNFGPARRLPTWFRRPMASGARADRVREIISRLGLLTVCSGARCPNMGECFGRGTATFMILGSVCTRRCGFCAVPSGVPTPPRDDEPEALAEACSQLGLKHVVITSVTRDDLPDGGAGTFAETIRAVRRKLPASTIEVLTPDFQGSLKSLETTLQAGPDIFNHNVETVPRLSALVRPLADYSRSIGLLQAAREWARRHGSPLRIKSGIMLGLGETADEVQGVLADLVNVGCDMLTIGQYLAPSENHLPVARFVPPGEFDNLRLKALAMGFRSVAAGPLVRSSYMAQELAR